jgi:hypothetical protein
MFNQPFLCVVVPFEKKKKVSEILFKRKDKKSDPGKREK